VLSGIYLYYWRIVVKLPLSARVSQKELVKLSLAHCPAKVKGKGHERRQEVKPQ
jgi:hypothetical protein